LRFEGFEGFEGFEEFERFEGFEEFEEFERDSGLICLQKQVRTTTLITELNTAKKKNIKLIEKTDLRAGLFLYMNHYYTILGHNSYLSDNQQ